MKGRLLVAAVGIPLLIVIVFFCPPVVTALAIAFLTAVAAREILKTTGIAAHRGILIPAMIMASLVPVWSYLGSAGIVRDLYTQILIGAIATFVFITILFVVSLTLYPSIAFSSLTAAVFAGIVIPLCLSSVVRILSGEYGRYYVIVPIMIPFISDSGAYFAGYFFGKHKMAPVLSPKKTWEGAVGGVAAGVVCVVIYNLVMHFAFGFALHFGICAVYGLLGAVISAIGDLAFSMVKRETGIKDYGTLFRAHGGVLDRFDSVIFAAPVVEMLILILPILK